MEQKKRPKKLWIAAVFPWIIVVFCIPLNLGGPLWEGIPFVQEEILPYHSRSLILLGLAALLFFLGLALPTFLAHFLRNYSTGEFFRRKEVRRLLVFFTLPVFFGIVSFVFDLIS